MHRMLCVSMVVLASSICFGMQEDWPRKRVKRDSDGGVSHSQELSEIYCKLCVSYDEESSKLHIPITKESTNAYLRKGMALVEQMKSEHKILAAMAETPTEKYHYVFCSVYYTPETPPVYLKPECLVSASWLLLALRNNDLLGMLESINQRKELISYFDKSIPPFAPESVIKYTERVFRLGDLRRTVIDCFWSLYQETKDGNKALNLFFEALKNQQAFLETLKKSLLVPKKPSLKDYWTSSDDSEGDGL